MPRMCALRNPDSGAFVIQRTRIASVVVVKPGLAVSSPIKTGALPQLGYLRHVHIHQRLYTGTRANTPKHARALTHMRLH